MTTSKTPSSPDFLQRWLLGWFPFWVYSGLVFESAVLPPRKIPHFLLHINDKVLHGTEYFILVLIALRTFGKAKTCFLREQAVWLALAYASLFGILTELAQLYVPGRACDFYDWLADFGGASAGLLLAGFLTRKKNEIL